MFRIHSFRRNMRFATCDSRQSKGLPSTSHLRVETFFGIRGHTSITSDPARSRISQTGSQYIEVDSIATFSNPKNDSHAANSF